MGSIENKSTPLKNMFMILLGNALIAFAVNTLVLENGIVCGGVSGVGSAIEYYFGVPLSLTVAILNVILFFLGLWYFGKGFAASILVSTIVFPVFLEVFNKIPSLHGYLDDSLLAMVIGGCLIGVGIGVVIKANASTGGVEILAQCIAKQFKLPVHTVLNVVDVVVLLLQFGYSNTTNAIYGVIMTFVTSSMIKKTLLSGRSLIQITVMSDRYEEIREMMLRHARMEIELRGEYTGIREMRKHVAWYTAGYPHSAQLRAAVNEVQSMEELEQLLEGWN